jgi:hypothetical protein
MTQMPSREQIIETMVEAYQEAYISYKPTSKTVAPYTLEIAWFPPSEMLMSAALQAMLKLLPDVPDPIIYRDVEFGHYQDAWLQLLQMRD